MSRADVLGERRIRDVVPVFAALGDETRLSLLARMGQASSLSVTDLTASAVMTRQAISKHLRVLEEAGLVRSARVGRERRWKVERTGLAEARRCMDALSAQWSEGLERLRRLVEE